MAGTPTQTGEAFGHEFAFASDEEPTNGWTDQALFDEASTEAPTEPAQAAPPTEPVVTPQQGEPEPPAEEGAAPTPTAEQPEAQAPAEAETEAEKQERLYAGRYKTVDELEQGYKGIQGLQGRQVKELQRKELENQQLRAALEQVVPYLEERQGLQQPAQALDPTQLTAEQLQAVIQQQVDQRVGQATQQVTQQSQQQAAQQQMRQAVESFMATHPDVAPGTPLDMAVGEVLAELQTDRQGQRRADLFPVTAPNLEVAYELAKEPALRNMVGELDLVPNNETIEIAKEVVSNPALAEVLLANPVLIDSDHGLAYARKQAQLPGMYSQAAERVAQPTPEQQRRAAYVETGGTGAPVTQAPGATPQDEMDEAIVSFGKGRDNIFGIAVE